MTNKTKKEGGYRVSKVSLLLVGALLVGGSAFAETTDTTLAPPGCYQGSGCDQNGWATVTGLPASGNTAPGTELGLTAIIRNVGAPGEGTNPGSIVGNTYYIPVGQQPGHPGDALWNFSWSINTGLNGNPTPLSQFTYLLTITDTTSGLSFSYNPFNTAPPLPHDNATSPSEPGQTAENSENLNFGFLSGPLNFNYNAPDDYTISLSETTPYGVSITDSINVDVVTPEPSTISLAGLALVGLWFVRRRHMQRS